MTDGEPTYDLFISYAEADRAWVEGYLLDALSQADVCCHSEAVFALGMPRLLEFERAVQQSQRILLILSPAYLTEGFTQFTDLLAQSYGLEMATWPVIPLILHPVKLPPRLAMLTALNATDPDTWPEVLERLLADMQRPLPSPPARPPCPYPGMVPFSEADSDRFFGRDKETQELLERLRLHLFITVIGPSGSGKSSLVFAGLIPALRKSGLFGPGEWLVRRLRPGETPLSALQATIGDVIDLQTFQRLNGQSDRLLLVVDQFEEVFALAGDEVVPFQEALLHLTQALNTYLIMTVRADFYPELMTSPLWPEIKAHRLEVLPLDEHGLRQAIVRPAEDVGVFVEAALVERLVADAADEPGILPLVQETMVLLWEKVERRFLPLRAYEALVLPRRVYGAPPLTGLQVAMARRADAALAVLTAERQTIARRIFLRLVQFGEGRADTRRQQPVAALRVTGEEPRLLDQTLYHLTDNRLLTLSGEEEGADRRVDIAHEALIAGWPALQGWLRERREAEQARRRLEGKAAEWERLGRGSGGLLDGVELAEAERWLASPDADDLGYNESLTALVNASRHAVRRVLWMRIAAMMLAVLFVITAVAVYALQQRAAAQREATLRGQVETQLAVARSRQVAAMARNRLDAGDSQLALLLGIAATEQITETVEATDILRDALDAWRGEDALLGHMDRVSHVVFSRNGQYLASIGDDNTARVWQLIGEHRVLVLRGHSDAVTDVAFSHDSRLLVTASRDDTTRVWEVSSGQTLHVLQQDGDVVTFDISPDGKTVATGSEDNLIWLWDLETGQRVRSEPFRADGAVQYVAFSPDGTILAAASTDGTAWLWQLPSGQLIDRLTGHDATVSTVLFSPDGRYVATRSGDSVRMWEVDSREPINLKQARHNAAVWSLAFSADGNFFATGSQDKTARLWDLRRLDAEPIILRGHTEPVWEVLFSPDSRLLATTSWDDTARLWRVDDGTLEAILSGHAEEIWNSAFSPDGRFLATPDGAGVVRLWRVQTGGDIVRHSTRSAPATALASMGERVAIVGEDGNVDLWNPSTGTVLTYKAGDSRLDTVAASADGARLAVGGVDGQITVLDANTGAIEATWLGHRNGVHALLFTPDGTHLASAGADTVIRLWDTGTWQPGIELRGHRNDVNGLAMGPDTATIVSASGDGTVRLWDWLTGEEQYALNTGKPLLAVALSPDKRSLAAGGHDDAVYIWDLAALDAEPLRMPHGAVVRALAFNPNGHQLASGDEDGTIRLWDLQMQEATTIRAYGTRWVSGVAYGFDGNLLFSTSRDGDVRAWPVQTADVLALACRRAGRDLSKTEWETFLSFIPFTELCRSTGPGPWLVSQQLDPPRFSPSPELPVANGRPMIRYFEAVPGSSVRFGENVLLRWDVEGVTRVYLEYGGERHGVTAPNEGLFTPEENITYRLLAINDAGEKTLTLTISVNRE